MAGKTRLGIEFTGIANGLPVAINGRGHVGQGRLDLELLADRVPLHFDVALVAIGSLDLILAVASRAEIADQPPDPIFARTDLTLLDEGHRELGRISTSLRIETGPGWVGVRGQFLEARTNLEAMERMTRVESVRCGLGVPLGPEGVALTSTAAVETSFGHEYFSVAVSRVVGLGEGWYPASGLDVREVTVERAGGRERDHRVLLGVEYGPARCSRIAME